MIRIYALYTSGDVPDTPKNMPTYLIQLSVCVLLGHNMGKPQIHVDMARIQHNSFCVNDFPPFLG